MKFLVRNYSCLQSPWLVGYRPQIPVVCPQLNLLNPPERNSWVRRWWPTKSVKPTYCRMKDDCRNTWRILTMFRAITGESGNQATGLQARPFTFESWCRRLWRNMPTHSINLRVYQHMCLPCSRYQFDSSCISPRGDPNWSRRRRFRSRREWTPKSYTLRKVFDWLLWIISQDYEDFHWEFFNFCQGNVSL